MSSRRSVWERTELELVSLAAEGTETRRAATDAAFSFLLLLTRSTFHVCSDDGRGWSDSWD